MLLLCGPSWCFFCNLNHHHCVGPIVFSPPFYIDFIVFDSHRFLHWAALFAILSAITTFLLWLLPQFYAVSPQFHEQALLHQNPFYMGRLWINFIHIFFALLAYGGAALLLSKHSPALSAVGFLSFLFWGFVELLGVSILIFAINQTWRAQYAGADPVSQGVHFKSVDGLSLPQA